MTEEEDSGDDWEGVIMSHSSGWLCVGDGGPLGKCHGEADVGLARGR